MAPPRAARHLLSSLNRQIFSAPPNTALRQARCSSSSSIPDYIFRNDNDDNPSALRHIHIQGHPSYNAATAVQDDLRQVFLDWKAAPTTPAPRPLVLTFTPKPTYTLGRRQKTPTAAQTEQLRQPLRVTHTTHLSGSSSGHEEVDYVPEVIETDRGGLTTYHGPGQVVFWPILDLRSPYYAHLTVRSYARLLEETTQAAVAHWGVETYLSEDDPGVWSSRAKASGGPERKIAAMGVHLRRHISGLGTAVNVDVVVDGDERTNPWARFVPCGLEGKTATSIRNDAGKEEWDGALEGELLASRWVGEFAGRLGVKVDERRVKMANEYTH